MLSAGTPMFLMFEEIESVQPLPYADFRRYRDDYLAHLKPLGLMFGPDVSTGDRATIGGMIGNNSAGARSLRYGKTVDHVLKKAPCRVLLTAPPEG